MSDEDIRERIIRLHDTMIGRPYAERIGPLEQAVGLADELGDERLGIAVRLALVTALTLGGRPSESFVPFAWLVQRYDADSPALTDEYRHAILWCNKWIVDSAPDYPQIPLAQVEALLADMQRRYTAAGIGPEPVAKCRYEFVSATRGEAAAEAEFDAWTALPRCEMSDCPACSARARAEHWYDRGRYERALELLAPVLQGGSACEEEPCHSLSLAALCAAELGRMDDAAGHHLRAWRQTRDDVGKTGVVDRHVLLCARTGALARGLELMAHRWEQVREFDNPRTGMLLRAAAARLVGACLAEGMAGQALRVHDGSELVIDQGLYDDLVARALETAAAYDARNGNDSVGRMVREDFIDAGPLPPMPLTTGTAPDARRAEPLNGLSSHPRAVRPDEIAAARPEDLEGLLDRILRWGGSDAAAAFEARWRTLRDEAIARAGSSGDPQLLRSVASLVVNSLRLAGAVHESQRLEATEIAIRLLEQAGDTVGAAALQHAIASAITHDEERAAALAEQVRASGDVEDILNVIGTAVFDPGDPASRRARLDELDSLGVTAESAPKLRGRWVGLVLMCCSGDPDVASALCERAAALLQPGEFPELQRRLVDHRAEALWRQDRAEEAAAVVDDAVGRLESAGALDQLAQALRYSGRIHQFLGDRLTAERRYQRALACAQRVGDPKASTHARGFLCSLLLKQGRDVEAIEVAEHALADLEIPDDPYVGWGTDAMLDSRTQIAGMGARLCLGLGETERSVSLARRGADDAIQLGRAATAAELLEIVGDGLSERDAIEALRAYTEGVEQARAAGDAMELLALQRRRMWSAADADGLDAGLAVHAEAVAAGQALCERVLTDPEFAERTNIDPEMTMLDIAIDRVRLLGSNHAADRALAELGDAPERILAHGNERFAATVHDLRARLRLAVHDERGAFADIGAAMGLADRMEDAALRRDFAALGATWLDREGRSDEAERFWAANRGRQED